MQNGANRLLLVLMLWPQLSEKSICLYLAFYFDLRSSIWIQFLNTFQIHVPPLVDIYALVSKFIYSQCKFHSYFLYLLDKRKSECYLVWLVFLIVFFIFVPSPLPQVHNMVSVAS